MRAVNNAQFISAAIEKERIIPFPFSLAVKSVQPEGMSGSSAEIPGYGSPRIPSVFFKIPFEFFAIPGKGNGIKSVFIGTAQRQTHKIAVQTPDQRKKTELHPFPVLPPERTHVFEFPRTGIVMKKRKKSVISFFHIPVAETAPAVFPVMIPSHERPQDGAIVVLHIDQRAQCESVIIPIQQRPEDAVIFSGRNIKRPEIGCIFIHGGIFALEDVFAVGTGKAFQRSTGGKAHQRGDRGRKRKTAHLHRGKNPFMFYCCIFNH